MPSVCFDDDSGFPAGDGGVGVKVFLRQLSFQPENAQHDPH